MTHTCKSLAKLARRPKVDGFTTGPVRIAKTCPARDNGEFFFKVKFVKKLCEELNAALRKAEDDGEDITDGVIEDVWMCDDATDAEAKRLVQSIGLSKDNAWGWLWGFHDWHVDFDAAELRVECIWEFNANR